MREGFSEADHLGAIEHQSVHLAAALHQDHAVGSFDFDGPGRTLVYGKFLGAEVLLAFDATVHDPAIDVSLGLSFGDRDGLKKMVVVEIGVYVSLQVELGNLISKSKGLTVMYDLV